MREGVGSMKCSKCRIGNVIFIYYGLPDPDEVDLENLGLIHIGSRFALYIDPPPLWYCPDCLHEAPAQNLDGRDDLSDEAYTKELDRILTSHVPLSEDMSHYLRVKCLVAAMGGFLYRNNLGALKVSSIGKVTCETDTDSEILDSQYDIPMSLVEAVSAFLSTKGPTEFPIESQGQQNIYLLSFDDYLAPKGFTIGRLGHNPR
jgi:hypothetical protein